MGSNLIADHPDFPLGGAGSCETYLAFGQDEGVILGFGCKRLAGEIAGKAADHNVLAEFGNFRAQQIFDRDVGIFDEALFEQTDRAVKLVMKPCSSKQTVL